MSFRNLFLDSGLLVYIFIESITKNFQYIKSNQSKQSNLSKQSNQSNLSKQSNQSNLSNLSNQTYQKIKNDLKLHYNNTYTSKLMQNYKIQNIVKNEISKMK